MQSPTDKWNRWATVFRWATISSLSAGGSALLFLILEVGNPVAMLAWFMSASLLMFVCNVGVKFCDLKRKDCERPGG